MTSRELPAALKSLKTTLTCAEQFDDRNPVVAYYCRLSFFTKAHAEFMSDETKPFLLKVMKTLEESQNKLGEGDRLNVVEENARLVFTTAYTNDMSGIGTIDTAKLFLTAGTLYDVVSTLGETNNIIDSRRLYCKRKAFYIINCVKRGIQPVPGMPESTEELGPNFDLGELPVPLDGGQEEQGHEEDPFSGMLTDPTPARRPSPPPDEAPSSSYHQYPANDSAAVAGGGGSSSAGGENYCGPQQSQQLDFDTCSKLRQLLKECNGAINFNDRETTVRLLKQCLSELGECV